MGWHVLAIAVTVAGGVLVALSRPFAKQAQAKGAAARRRGAAVPLTAHTGTIAVLGLFLIVLGLASL